MHLRFGRTTGPAKKPEARIGQKRYIWRVIWCLLAVSATFLPAAHTWSGRVIGARPNRYGFASCAAVVGACAGLTPDPVVGAAMAVTVPSIVVLLHVDVHRRRLPDRALLPMYPVIGLVLILAGIDGSNPDALLRAAAGATVCLFGYGAICAATGGLGFGDVKLAGVIGLLTGWVSWPVVATATVVALIIGGVQGVLTAVVSRRRSEIPFGPAMLAGAALALMGGLPVRQRTDHDRCPVGTYLGCGLPGLGDVIAHRQHRVGASVLGLFQ